jgi:nucleotide-binding universal stress UspA family protein
MTAPQCLVPVDFSPSSDRALDYALALAQKLQARLLLFHVLFAHPYPMPEIENEAEQAMQAAVQRVHDAGLAGESSMIYGNPWQEIVALAKAKQVDLIIMGTHGRTVLRYIVLGSVAEQVVRRAPCSVLVVR